ncbi:hypothetical protein X975_00667, partial [Stegodyphus mimosarum]
MIFSFIFTSQRNGNLTNHVLSLDKRCSGDVRDVLKHGG